MATYSWRTPAHLLQRGAARMLVELAPGYGCRQDAHIGRLLLPHQQRTPHVVGRADQEDAFPPVLAEDVVHELHHLVGVDRALLEPESRKPAPPDSTASARMASAS
jgi:hypothetical protein